MAVTIRFYEEWMKNQVAKMFCLEYAVNQDTFAKHMDIYYDHPFQKNKCIRIVALDGDKVVGFQSFFYWPYNYGKTTLNSYQSGNSLIHPDYRGKGIFNKLLQFIEIEKIGADFFLGFPVEMSKKNFIKDNWKNILNLTWFIRISNPMAFLFPTPEKQLSKYFQAPHSISIKDEGEYFRLNADLDFIQWRKEYSLNTPYYYYEYTYKDQQIIFELKFNKRKKIINELIIGDIKCSNPENQIVLKKALKALIKKTSKMMCITILSIAINEDFEHSIASLLKESMFYKLSKSIYFIVKPSKTDTMLLEKKKWNLYRSDLDTW